MVPALTYPTALPPATAASVSRALTVAGRLGAGLSSMSFWWRRWIEHSRSCRCTSWPCATPNTCTSTWAGGHHEPARRDLVAHLLDHLPGGPDEDDPGALAGLREAPVLRKKAVAGMDGLDAGAPGGIEDALDVEVALARRGGADGHGLIG